MKILIQNPNEPILEGVAQVLSNIDEELIIWNGPEDTTPLNDLLDIHQPDLTIGYPDDIKCRPQNKLLLIGEHNGHLEPDLICISASDLTYHKQRQLEQTKYWDRYLIIEVAANFTNHNIEYDQKYATDIFYYSQNTTLETLSYLLEIEKYYQLKIIGQHRIPLTSYLGVGDIDDILKFAQSCKIALAFDLPTLYFYAVNQIFCVTNQENLWYPTIRTLEDIKTHIDISLNDEHLQQCQSSITEAYQSIILGHTYFHRTHSIFTRLGYTEQAEKCLNYLKQITQ